MQNQSSPAALLFPTVPANYCPAGTWSDILNSFISLYLNNGTINIPGLGLVTPQQIETINANIQTLNNEIAALTINTQSGSQSISTAGSQTFNISLGTPMPNSTYQIGINFVCTSGTFTVVPQWALIGGTQTTTGFRVSIYSTDADVNSFNWAVNSITTA